MPIHSLHIGKTGGTAINHAVKPYLEQYSMTLHPHARRLSHIPKGESVYFILRDPITRFVSSFYSRQRCGMPRFNSPWDLNETRAFGIFKTARSLGEALSASDPKLRDEAENAMRGIIHVNMGYKCWFWNYEEIENRGQDIILIGLQEDLDADFERLKRIIGLPNELQLTKDPVLAHAMPVGFDTTLSDLALENLKAWYAEDIQFYDQCVTFRNSRIAEEKSLV